MIVAVGGLPGVGKTTTARAVARALQAAHLRIDALEAALVVQNLVPGLDQTGPHGYGLALAVADSCLAAGTSVVADAVFDVADARDPWTALAQRHGTPVSWVRLVCGDPVEHRRRVEQRTADLPGHRVPTWAAVVARAVDDWTGPHTVVDTVDGDPVTAVLAAVAGAD